MIGIDITTILTTLASVLISGGGVWAYMTKSGRVKARADAYKAMAEQYEYRLDQANDRVKIANGTEKGHLERISELNHALDDKTDQIRKQVQKVWEAEQEINRVNAELIKARDEIADLRVDIERYKAWHCRHAECQNRRPPNPALKGQKYEE